MPKLRVLFRRDRALQFGLVSAVIFSMIGGALFSHPTRVRAADDSITITGATIALHTDNESIGHAGHNIADIGDVVRVSVSVNNTDGGCVDAGTVVTADMTEYGGSSNEELTCITDGGGVTNDLFRLDFTVADAGGDGIDVGPSDSDSQVDVTASDDDEDNGSGDPNPDDFTSSMAKAVDTIAPTVSEGAIATNTGSGTDGAFIVDDFVNVSWDDTVTGDDNGDTDQVTVDFSQFGGPSDVEASIGMDGFWDASYQITGEEGIDATGRSASVTAYDDAGNSSTTSANSDSTVDTEVPVITQGNISISGASGDDGSFVGFDSVTATWDAGADGNADIVEPVTVDFTEFGGGAAVPAEGDGGVWTATFAIPDGGSMDLTGLNVSFTATDDAGNQSTTTGNNDASLDNQDPILDASDIGIDVSGCDGTCKVGDTLVFTWDANDEGNDDTFQNVAIDLSNFGGDVNTFMYDDGTHGDAFADNGIWTVSYTLTEGHVDNESVAVDGITVRDDAGNTSHTGASTDTADIDNEPPVISSGNISVSGASGTAGAFKVGDTVTVTWNNKAEGGDNNPDIVFASADLSDWGGLVGAVMTEDDGATDCPGGTGESADPGLYCAHYTITGGEEIDGAANATTAVEARDDAGNLSNTIDDQTYTVDATAPNVTDGNISLSGATGTEGAFKIGDTVTASWNANGDGGDGEVDSLASVTVDFSAFGGGAAVTALETDGVWSATYPVSAGVLDATGLNVSFQVTDDAGNETTTADHSDATVDKLAPVISDSHIDVSGATGTLGAFKVGDTVTVTWNNNAEGGDNNADIVFATADLSDWGVRFEAIMAQDDGSETDCPGGTGEAADPGLYCASHTITGTEGIDGTDNATAAVTATDDAGNITHTSDDQTYTVDSDVPVMSEENIFVSGATGTDGSFKIGNTITATWNASGEGGDGNTDVISSVTADFSAFGGGSAVVAVDQEDGTWTATYLVPAGSLDDSGLAVSFTAVDNAGNSTTTAGVGDNKIDNQRPLITEADLNIDDSGCSGTAGACIVGDTVVFTWDAGEEGNTDTFQDVSVDLTGFGGDTYVTMYDDGSHGDAHAEDGIWTITRTLTEGSQDDHGISIAITVTDDADNVKNSSWSPDSATVDDVLPTVSTSHISVSGASGTDGAFKVGDTVSVTWDDGASGDNQAAEVSDVYFDLSQFGGGSHVHGAVNGSNVWSAAYTIIGSEGIDTTNRNVVVKATDNAGNETDVTGTNSKTVDTEAPNVTDPNISISGATGIVGFKIGDTVTATWNNTVGGDHETDTLASVTVDFSQFGGGSAVVATNASNTWTATYLISAGSIDSAGLNISFNVTDNAGNLTVSPDTTSVSADNIAPTVTDARISISGATGTAGAYKIGDTVTASWNNTGSGDNNADTIDGVTVDFSQFGGGSAVVAGNSSNTWTAVYTIVAGSIDTTSRNVSITVTDNAGNTTTQADGTNATVDNIRPTMTVAVMKDNSGADGLVDMLTLTFSEAPANVSAAANGFDVTSASTHGTCNTESIDPDGSSTTLNLTFACTTVATNVGDLTLAFTANSNLVDHVGNQMSTVTLTSASSPAITDGAKPVITARETRDGDADGLIDGVDLTLSEPVSDATLGSGAGGWEVSTYAGEAVGTGATANDNKIRVTFTEGVSGDTDATPTIAYAPGTLADASANALLASSATATADKAAPVLMSSTPENNSTGRSTSTAIDVVFSEPMDTTDFPGVLSFDPSMGTVGRTWSNGNRDLELNPAASLNHSTTYGITFASTTSSSAAGDADMAETTISFRTIASSSSSGGGGGGGTSSTAATITLTEPTTNGSWAAGSTQNITWTKSGSGISTIELDYSINAGVSYIKIADGLSASATGSYAWTIPSNLLGKVVVKAIAYDSGKANLDTDTVTFTVGTQSVVTEGNMNVDGTHTDDTGRLIAPDSTKTGPSPFTGETQTISTVQSGWFIRCASSSSVYYVDSSMKRRPIWDANTFFTYGTSWNQIVWVTDATLPTLSMGQPMLPKHGVALVKIQSDANVYAVDLDANGASVLRLIPSEDVAKALYGSAWADYVIDVDPTIFAKFGTGSVMTTTDSVDMTKMKTRMTLASEAAAS